MSNRREKAAAAVAGASPGGVGGWKPPTVLDEDCRRSRRESYPTLYGVRLDRIHGRAVPGAALPSLVCMAEALG